MDDEYHNKIKEELLEDFWHELDKVDFTNYRPDSPLFMYPTTIGMLYLVLDKVSPSHSIEEELDDSEKYLNMYGQTKDPAYHTMAGDELKHGKFLLSKMKQEYPNKDFSRYDEKILEIQSKL